jgi:membrane fusion protein, multidrug efflux system
MRQPVIFAVVLALILSGCSAPPVKTAFKSMEQIQKEEGIPVRTSELRKAVFSAYLKYPATLRARSESTASSMLSDVVREVHFNVGDYVEKDRVVVSFSRDNSAYIQAKASFDNAAASYERNKTLFESKGIAQQTIDNVKTQYEIARSAYASARDSIDVRAPISGYLTRLNVQTTDNVRKDDPLFTVSNLADIEARIWVSPSEIAFVRQNQRAVLDWNGKPMTGKVKQISLIMDSQKKASLVTVSFSNQGTTLTSGMSADVSIETYRNPEALVVDRKTMTKDPGGYAAFVAVDGHAEKRQLTLGREQGFQVEVLKGLNAGEALITEGAQTVSDGSKIRIIPAQSSSLK